MFIHRYNNEIVPKSVQHIGTFKSISSEISVLLHPTSWIKVSLKPIIVYDPHPHTQKSLKGKFLQAFYGFKCLRCKY